MRKAAFLGLCAALLFLVGFLLLPAADLPHKKVVILGIDGMDPQLLNGFIQEGIMPNFSTLAAEGDFQPLQTTMPPLSPVAWSTFITGTQPGRHGIFDFLHRDPETIQPEFSMVKTIPADWTLSLGSWEIPLKGGQIEQLRQGPAFWESLEARGIPVTIYRMPVNFPPVESGRALSGMGTPDILGTPGTFSFYTEDPPPGHQDISGGRVVEVVVENGRVQADLIGPDNTFRKLTDGSSGNGSPRHPPMTAGFTVEVDPENPVARFSVLGNEFILNEGEWSDWIAVEFEALPYLVTVSAVGRFYLQEVRPSFKLYVTPLQISPANPAMPITYPESWSAELYEELGYFYTQELPEDTKAFSGGILDAREFWEQSQYVYREQREALDLALEQFEDGLLFFYFSSVDQGCHMLWRYMDPAHPAYVEDGQLKDAIRILYREMDEALGRILERVDSETTVIVMSDHGFSPFYWEVNLNSWLAQKGYVQLIDQSAREGQTFFSNVDWSRTRAYAVGLNGLYVNLRGREYRGIVSQGYDYQTLLSDLERDLLAMKDPRNGRNPVAFVLRTGEEYSAASAAKSPDLIVGYARGYRSSWKSPLGEFPREVFADNLDPWSGDHSIDFREVPGVLLTNRKITLEKPALYDLTVAVLDEYGVGKLPHMLGQDCLE
jgi:predicted AlkP superfamily phosphohydrolase/phosphomutase